MLSLSISAKPCLPGRKYTGPQQDATPTRCEVCGAPGGKSGELLERHLTTGGKYKHVCPMCHHCLHLDFAGMKSSGRVIWLPEMSQETLNLLSLAMFMVIKKIPADTKDQTAIELRNHSKNLYGAFRRRAEHVEIALGSNIPGIDRIGLRGKLSEPQHIASLIAYAAKYRKSAGQAAPMTEREVAKALDGLRFLPSPIFFDAYTSAVAATLPDSEGPAAWMGMIREYHEQESAKLAAMPSESFDASGHGASSSGEMEVEPEPDDEADLEVVSLDEGMPVHRDDEKQPEPM